MADRENDRDRQALREALMGDRRAGDHLAYEQLAELADNTADDVDREIAEVHLDVCPQCRADLSDLKALNAPTVAKASEAFSGWSRLAAAAAIVALAGAGLWVLKSWSGRQVQDEPTVASATTPAPRVVTVLNDAGGQISIDDAGVVHGLDSAPAPLVESVRSALVNRRLHLPVGLGDLQPKAGVLMGAQPAVAFSPSAPVGTLVRGNRPTFRWQPLAGATSYVVSVFDTNFNKIAASDLLTSTEWVPNAPLPRGTGLVWQIVARRGDSDVKSAPEARFRIVDRDRVAEIERLERTLPASRLLRAVAYAEAGLLDEAEVELQLALQANPDSAIVKALLEQVTSGRRRS